jgi:hypothetical protein
MTREEAIKRLKSLVEVRRKYFDMQTMKDEIECLDMAIKALEEQPSENEQIIRIKKGTLKVRTGRYVVHDVEWLKTHFNTTEAKIYGQPSEDCISRKAVLDALHRYFADGFDSDKWWNSTYVLGAINEVPSAQPKTGQPSEDCISRKFMHDMGATCIAARNKDGDLVALGALDILPSVYTTKPKTGHWLSQSEYCKMNNLIPSGLGCYFWCSECNCGIDYKYFHLANYKYCPQCGAKMQEVQK